MTTQRVQGEMKKHLRKMDTPHEIIEYVMNQSNIDQP